MRWSCGDIADAVAAALAARARADDCEQAVYGFDALNELGLHPLVQEALLEPGFGAWAEQRYPHDDHHRGHHEGKRCDLVLTPGGRPLRDAGLRGTLFDTPTAVDPEKAFWLEIKTVPQYGPEGPSPRYAAELRRPVVKDVQKLQSDTTIRHAGLLLVLFTAEAAIAQHDLLAWHAYCLQKTPSIALPATRHIPITDRIGHGCCSVAVFEVKGGGMC